MVLRLRVASPGNWQEAKCLGVKTADTAEDYDPFFPADTDSDGVRDAKDFCNGEADGVVCPIREQCLMFALTNNEKHGVWGGMDELGRRGLRKKWPLTGGRKTPRDEWTWMQTSEAVEGLEMAELLAAEELDPAED